MRQEILRELQAARRAHRPVALATDLASGEQWLFAPSDPLPAELDPELADGLREVFRNDRARRVELGERTIFLNVFNPPLRMILVGAVHIAQPLAAMAAATGFQVIVVDPRTAFAAPKRFPDLEIRTDWPDEALAALVPDARTAVVTLTHDPKLDDPALDQALRSDAFYIGSLGSRKTHGKRVERLRGEGFSEEAIARIHGPVGLDIGARSPAEIALSILAQIIGVLRTRAS